MLLRVGRDKQSLQPIHVPTANAKVYPIHVVTAWLGNTPSIALRHYLLTTDEDFDKAAATPNPTNESPNEPPTNAVQKAVQQGAETARNVSKCQCGNSRNAKENGRLRELATCHDVCVINISGGHGGRNSGPFSKEIDRSDRSGADCGALAETRTNSPDLEHALNDPELVAIVAAWPSLSASVRAGINALIRDSGGQYE